MSGLLYLTCLFVIQCGCATERFVSQLESTVRVQLRHSTSLECQAQLSGSFSIFWIKIPLNEAPICVATAQTYVDVTMCKQFENHSRIKVTWNKKTFNLSFSSVEQTDVATYFCGMYSYGHLFFGNGSKLILEEHADATVSPNITIKDNEENHGKVLRYEHLVPALAVTNVASISFIIWLCHLLKKKQLGVTAEVFSASGNVASDKVKTDQVNYAALTSGDKQRRTVQRRTSVDTIVIYEAVQHQEES